MKKFITHFKKIGFTNRLAIYILLFLLIGLFMGFYLAIKSIQYQYMGALACFTVVFTPIGTIAGTTFNRIVDKSKAENTGGNGDGIKFATVMQEKMNESEFSKDSPPI